MKRDAHLRPFPRRARLLALLALLTPTLAAVACNSVLRPRTERAVPATQGRIPDRGYDVEHYALELDLFPLERRIEGVCTVRMNATRDGLDEVVLDLVGMEVVDVADASGATLSYERDGALLRVELPAPATAGEPILLAIRYGGTPVTGLWFSGDDGTGNPNQVFTQGETNHSRGWFPCYDHPSDRATSEIEVTMPADWVSVAPGRRLDSIVDGPYKTEHWRMDVTHPSYLVSLCAGDYVVEEEEWDGVPLWFVGENRYRPWFEASFDETDDVLDFLSRYTGRKYPYSKYSQTVVANFPWGGMENISATTLTPLTLDDERGNRDSQSHALVAHEAAHQWFGDLITCKDWEHVWLNEGFATYMTGLYFEATRGEDEFRARMRDDQDAYLAEDVGNARRSTVSSAYSEPEDLFDTRVYQGAAARLHLLRFLLGDELFRSCVRTWVEEFAERDATTQDFQAVVERVSGRDLSTFFDQWFYGRGFPEFVVDWSHDSRDEELTVDVVQTQDSHEGTPAAFRVPVNIEVHDSRGTSVHRVELGRRSERFTFPAPERPYYVHFDSGGWIPKTVEYRRRAPSEWMAISKSCEDVNARRDAAAALGALAEEVRDSDQQAHEIYVAELVGRLRRDGSPWVRAAAATALGRAGGLEARERLSAASGEDAEARVRIAALKALWSWGPSPELAALAERRFAEGYSWNTMGAAAGLLVRADPERAYGWISEKLFLDSPHDQLRAQLFEQLGTIDDPAVADQLLRWARDESVHPTARAVALAELAKEQNGRTRNAEAIAPFLSSESFRLRQAAVDALAELRDPRARAALKAYYPRSKTSRERRVIEASLASGATAAR